MVASGFDVWCAGGSRLAASPRSKGLSDSGGRLRGGDGLALFIIGVNDVALMFNPRPVDIRLALITPILTVEKKARRKPGFLV
jgi:hypothetical protein